MKTVLIRYSFLFFIVFLSCNGFNKNKLHVDLSDVDIPDIEVKRYGMDLFSVNPDNLKNDLEALSGKYDFFLGGNIDDTLSLIQIRSYITDPYLREIFSSSIKKYPDLDDLNINLTAAFRYYKYYYPDERIPDIYTYISGLDFEFPVRLVDTVMIIALDMYLGGDSKFYKQLGLPLYKSNFNDEHYIVPDCMKELAIAHISYDISTRSFLEQMVYYGKILYFIDAMLPDVPDKNKIKYTDEQLEWCKKNESDVWSLFIDQQLLYSKDMAVISKFINDGPFTAGLAKESPARIGHWIGWQIARAYMKKNDFGLHELLSQHDAQKILAESSYKPVR